MSVRARQSRLVKWSVRAAELLAAAAPGALELPDGLKTGAVFLGGHSYGGPAALLAAASAPTDAPAVALSGLLLHDPALGMGADVWAVRRGARAAPTLSYVSDEYDRFGVRCGDATLHTVGGFHGNFVDAPLWAPGWVMTPLSLLIPASGPCDAGCLGDSAATMIEYAMEIFRDDLADGAVEAASVEECRSHCITKQAAGCLAFTFYGDPAPGQPAACFVMQ